MILSDRFTSSIILELVDLIIIWFIVQPRFGPFTFFLVHWYHYLPIHVSSFSILYCWVICSFLFDCMNMSSHLLICNLRILYTHAHIHSRKFNINSIVYKLYTYVWCPLLIHYNIPRQCFIFIVLKYSFIIPNIHILNLHDYIMY